MLLFGGIAWTKEGFMMLPKVHGGLAMCNLEDMNSSCLMKLGWYIQNGNKKLRGKHVRRACSKDHLAGIRDVRGLVYGQWKCISLLKL